MKQEWTLIQQIGTRALYRWEARDSEGQWHTLYRGTGEDSPQEPIFQTEAQGRAWLTGQAPAPRN